jgi:hypothetical protein
MAGEFSILPAPVIRNAGDAGELVLMRRGMLSQPRIRGPPVTNIRNTSRLIEEGIAIVGKRELDFKLGLKIDRMPSRSASAVRRPGDKSQPLETRSHRPVCSPRRRCTRISACLRFRHSSDSLAASACP